MLIVVSCVLCIQPILEEQWAANESRKGISSKSKPVVWSTAMTGKVTQYTGFDDWGHWSTLRGRTFLLWGVNY